MDIVRRTIEIRKWDRLRSIPRAKMSEICRKNFFPTTSRFGDNRVFKNGTLEGNKAGIQLPRAVSWKRFEVEEKFFGQS